MKHSFLERSRRDCCSVILAGAVVALMLSSTSTRAEFYFGGAIGGNFPLDFSDVELNAVNKPPVDLQLENSLAYGGKAGYFFPSLKWLGVELEAFNTNPNIKQQIIVVNGVPSISVESILRSPRQPPISSPGILGNYSSRILESGLACLSPVFLGVEQIQKQRLSQV